MRGNVRVPVVVTVIAGLLRQVWSRTILGLVVVATDATISAMRTIDAHAGILPAVLGIATAALLMLLEFLSIVGGTAATHIYIRRRRWCRSRNRSRRTGTQSGRKTDPVRQLFAGRQDGSVGSLLLVSVLVQTHRRRCAW